MDNLENRPSQSPAQPDPEELQAQFASLGSLLNSILVLVLVLSGVVDLYLVRQVKNTRAELTGMRNYVGQAQRNSPAIDEFVRKLAEYGRSHTDFAPVMTKYGLKPPALTNAAPSSGMPAPASSIPAPAPKSTKK